MTRWGVGSMQWLGGRTNEWPDHGRNRPSGREKLDVAEPFKHMQMSSGHLDRSSLTLKMPGHIAVPGPGIYQQRTANLAGLYRWPRL